MLYRFICPVLGFLKRIPYLLPISLAVIFFMFFGSIIIAKLYQFSDKDKDRGATAIDKGAYGESYSMPRYLEQGWSAANSLWFYNTSQGSGLMPYDFFLVLQQGDTTELFRSDKNIDKFRYLPQKKTDFNLDALPVGFTKMTYKGKDYVGYTCAACHTAQINYKEQAIRIDGGPAMADMVGFLTALEQAMDVAQKEKLKTFIADVKELNNDYKKNDSDADKKIIADLEKWRETLRRYNIINHSQVKLVEVISDKEPPKVHKPTDLNYGHARLDAFGRIYNRVVQYAISKDQFAKELALVLLPGDEKKRLLSDEQIKNVLDGLGTRIVFSDEDFAKIVERLLTRAPGYPGLDLDGFLLVRDKIFNSPNAPVSYPFLWDISHSDFLQWNGLAPNAGPGPLGRNAGEVIGVFGILDWGTQEFSWEHPLAGIRKFSLAALFSGQQNKKEIIGFNSSINIFNLQRLESQLTSLKSPEWPFCRKGKDNYYLPPPRPGAEKEAIKPNPDIKKGEPPYCLNGESRFDEKQKDRGELVFIDRCRTCHAVIDRSAWDRVVIGHMSDVDLIKTDPAMAENSVKHNGKSGNFKDTYQATDAGTIIVKEDAPVVQILTAATKGVIATPDADKYWPRRVTEWVYALVMSFADNTIKESVKEGNYKPDTTAEPYASLHAYKGRSLNGIWATAPYLHNGSVPTLYDLLLPADKRPKSFMVGRREFDPVKVGFVSEGNVGTEFKTTTVIEGKTLDLRGNLNTGHEGYCHKNEKELPEGGCLTKQERDDLLEYLRSL